MSMAIADRLREMREEKKLSQGDIEKRTGLLRCYISRVENGHTVPAIETVPTENSIHAFDRDVTLLQFGSCGWAPELLTHLVKNLKRIEKARFPVSHFSRTAGF
jgi:transcriptional regulator with XRE-family HTH domain